jgi:hypothetical protein
MSIQKKSLISTLKTAKKANVASDVKGEKIASMRVPYAKAAVTAKTVGSTKMAAKSLKSLKSANFKSLKANSAKVNL